MTTAFRRLGILPCSPHYPPKSVIRMQLYRFFIRTSDRRPTVRLRHDVKEQLSAMAINRGNQTAARVLNAEQSVSRGVVANSFLAGITGVAVYAVPSRFLELFSSFRPSFQQTILTVAGAFVLGAAAGIVLHIKKETQYLHSLYDLMIPR